MESQSTCNRRSRVRAEAGPGQSIARLARRNGARRVSKNISGLASSPGQAFGSPQKRSDRNGQQPQQKIHANFEKTKRRYGSAGSRTRAMGVNRTGNVVAGRGRPALQ